ncbi:MAG: Holliday junction branch migration protein RuvA [Bacteroidetes bacterium]|nr:Holliday junction branch migration protein RuvA [Bacteroidota bacterium]
MISHLNGILISKTTTEAIIECNGVGYQINISLNTSNVLPNVNDKVFLHTLLIHREDAMQLYGFYDKSERSMFILLTSVSGIGPKFAIGILSSITVSDLKYAIEKGNILLLKKMPGIGPKTAERLLVELKDKISKIEIESAEMSISLDDTLNDAISALVTLGYNRAVAEKAVRKTMTNAKDIKLPIEDIIRTALKYVLQ